MFENIDGKVLLNTINDSPKFRKNYIEIKQELDPKMIDRMIELFKLDLIDDIYCKGQKLESFNSKKRARLKMQEVILINKIEIYRHTSDVFDKLVADVLEIEVTFAKKFDYKFVSDADNQFASELIDKYFSDFTRKYMKKRE